MIGRVIQVGTDQGVATVTIEVSLEDARAAASLLYRPVALAPHLERAGLPSCDPYARALRPGFRDCPYDRKSPDVCYDPAGPADNCSPPRA